MTDQDIEIQRLKGELSLKDEEVEWFAREMDFWRRKYLMDHPEHDNWDYVESARETEGED